MQRQTTFTGNSTLPVQRDWNCNWFRRIACGFLFAACCAHVTAATNEVDPRSLGARGDGITIDTAAINAAVELCASNGGGAVVLTPGRYVSGTIHLRSHVALRIDAGATLVGTTNLAEYQQPTIPSDLPEAKWGKWHRALIVGENVEDVSICGPGTIDGNKVFDPTGEEKMRGPHTIDFVNCRRLTIRDVNIVDSANYAVFFQISDDVEIRNVKITGGWDGVHFRGSPERWCKNVMITGSQIYSGDDAIAGRYWDNTVIADCILNSACNGIRLIGPATHLIVNNCLFFGPGRQPHRSSGDRRRTNMLSGIILQPGAWDSTHGMLDDVLLANNTMHDVASPVTLWSKPGNLVGRVTVNGLRATGVYRSAFSAEGWSDAPITNVVLRDIQAEFSGGGTEEQAHLKVKGPGVDARPLPAWGLYVRNVENMTLEDVRFSLIKGDLRPAVFAESVPHLTFDNFRIPDMGGAGLWLATTNVGAVTYKGAKPK